MSAIAGALFALVAGVCAFFASLGRVQKIPQVTLRSRILVHALRIFFERVSSVQHLSFWCNLAARPWATLLRAVSYIDGMRYKAVEINVAKRLEVVLSCDPPNSTPSSGRTLKAEWVMTAANWREGSRSNVALFFHGGFFISMDAHAYRPLTRKLAMLGFSVLAINQRLQPENTFQDTIHDACVAYQWLLQDIGVPANSILLIGEGTGANLALQLASACEEKSLPIPGGLCLLSPFFEWNASLKSKKRNFSFDYLSILNNKNVNLLHIFEQEAREEHVSETLAQPFMDVSRETPIMPTLIQSSSMSQLADGTERFLARQRKPAVSIEHDLIFGTPHAAHYLSQFVQMTTGKSLQIAFNRIWQWWAVERHHSPPGIKKTLISGGGKLRHLVFSANPDDQ